MASTAGLVRHAEALIPGRDLAARLEGQAYMGAASMEALFVAGLEAEAFTEAVDLTAAEFFGGKHLQMSFR